MAIGTNQESGYSSVIAFTLEGWDMCRALPGYHRKCVVFRKPRSDSRSRPCFAERLTYR